MNITERDLGEKKILPIKILAYNGYPFHYEMCGFILEFCSKNNIEIDLYLKHMDESWIELYRKKYVFNVVDVLPCNLQDYLFVLLLTDDDTSISENMISENVVCIDHYYKNRRPLIKHHIPIAPFQEDIKLYSFPVFEYINYEDKIKLLSNKQRPIITFLGFSTIPYDNNTILSLIDNTSDFDIYIINKQLHEYYKYYVNLPNIFIFENIPATKLYELLTESTYICYIPNGSINCDMQRQCHTITSSMFVSFTTGNKLIIPKDLNKFLKLSSIVEYSYGDKLILDKTPSLIETFNEREKLIHIRDNSILNLDHMKMLFESKYTD